MAEAVQRGFNVMRPWGESARYDVLLERNGRYLRVQVKSTTYKIGNAYVCGLRSDNRFKPIAAPRSTSSPLTSSPPMSGTSCQHARENSSEAMSGSHPISRTTATKNISRPGTCCTTVKLARGTLR
jgi:hypothetical protein